jgi:hypothetical protein
VIKAAAPLVIALLLAAACEPDAPALDGAPAPAAEDAAAPGELAGASPAREIILPGVMNIAAPTDARVTRNCEAVIAADYDKPPVMECVFFLRDGDAASPEAEEFDRILGYQLTTAGWMRVRSTGALHYFELPRPGADCADLSVFTALDAAQIDRLRKAANAEAAPDGKSWRGYSVPAIVRETCGADRMTPEAR